MIIVYDAQHRPLELGIGIGQGGEATVYRMLGQQDRLAKIYEPEPRPNYAGKLSWMVEHPPENPTRHLAHASLAWPGGLLFDSRRHLKGYWMPYIQHTVSLLDVFNPHRRVKVLPQFDRRYLLRTARNLAAALSALHQSGYVAGDLNESNVLVTPTAMVTLIDTDSFQVAEERHGNRVVYPCPVGKPDYTPPELQGKALSEVLRQPDHDAFGLAVLIFQLLMEGSHPFRAQWLAAGDPPPLEVRIANGAYPYVAAPAYPVLPPNNALGIETLHPWLVDLFQRCFVEGHRDPRWRPGPELWARALAEAEKAQVCCAQGHYYSSHLTTCPYCAIQQKRIARQGVARAEPAAAGAGQPQAAAGRAWKGWSPAPRSAPPPSFNPRATPAPPRPPVWGRGPGPGAAPPAARVASAASGSGAASGAAATFTPFNPLGHRAGGWARAARPSAAPGAGPMGVLRSRPLIPQGFMRHWVRQRAYKSITVGGLQGALVGAVPGAAIGLFNWFSGDLLAWTLLFALAGTAGGLLRGWKPGHRLASLIDRYIGWKIFWQALGLVTGMTLGGMVGMIFVWAVLPVILGLVLGAQGGVYLGRKLWQLGQPFGWERIWGAISGLGFGALGYGLARLAGVLGMNALGAQLSLGLLPFAANESIAWALAWMLAGAAGGALSGALAGILADLLGRLTGLVN